MMTEKNFKNKLTCTVTGRVVSVAPKVFAQRALKYGSEDILRNNYISAVARKLLCAGETVEDIRKKFNVDVSVPYPEDVFIKKYTRWAKYRNKQTKPDILIINEQA